MPGSDREVLSGFVFGVVDYITRTRLWIGLILNTIAVFPVIYELLFYLRS
jgi:hypothetical protein